MELGERIQTLPFSEDEMHRLSDCIADRGSLHHQVLLNHHRCKLFSDICKNKNLAKKFHGFRNTSNAFKKMVFDDAISAFANHSASSEWWALYKKSVIEHLQAEAPQLNELLLNVEIEEVEVQEEDTESILNLVAANALDYEVLPSHVEELYSLWHFRRFDGFRKYIANFPQPNLSEALNKKIAILKKDFANELEEAVSKIDRRPVSEKDALRVQLEKVYDIRLGEIESEIKSIAARTSALAQETEAEFNKAVSSHNELSDRFYRIEKLNRTLRDETVDSESFLALLEELNTVKQVIGNLATSVSELEGSSLRQAVSESSETQAGVIVANRSNFASALRELRLSKPRAAKTEIRLEVAAAQFESTLDENEKGTVKCQAAFATSLYLNCVVYPTLESFHNWSRCVGWDEFITTVCAAPNWVDQTVLEEQFCWLIEQPSTPRTLVILDFDVGYTEGYLVPLVKMLCQSLVYAPCKKVVLVPSQPDWQAPASLLRWCGFFPNLYTVQESFSMTTSNKKVSTDEIAGHPVASVSLRKFSTAMPSIAGKEPAGDLQSDGLSLHLQAELLKELQDDEEVLHWLQFKYSKHSSS